ncbi:unnamed protein product [Amoebophrya sp. A120]|nr:unnamed protein product [Amoebophrya sp. A120]|eukprot:GSA120T00018987001.1
MSEDARAWYYSAFRGDVLEHSPKKLRRIHFNTDEVEFIEPEVFLAGGSTAASSSYGEDFFQEFIAPFIEKTSGSTTTRQEVAGGERAQRSRTSTSSPRKEKEEDASNQEVDTTANSAVLSAAASSSTTAPRSRPSMDVSWLSEFYPFRRLKEVVKADGVRVLEQRSTRDFLLRTAIFCRLALPGSSGTKHVWRLTREDLKSWRNILRNFLGIKIKIPDRRMKRPTSALGGGPSTTSRRTDQVVVNESQDVEGILLMKSMAEKFERVDVEQNAETDEKDEAKDHQACPAATVEVCPPASEKISPANRNTSNTFVTDAALLRRAAPTQNLERQLMTFLLQLIFSSRYNFTPGLFAAMLSLPPRNEGRASRILQGTATALSGEQVLAQYGPPTSYPSCVSWDCRVCDFTNDAHSNVGLIIKRKNAPDEEVENYPDGEHEEEIDAAPAFCVGCGSYWNDAEVWLCDCCDTVCAFHGQVLENVHAVAVEDNMFEGGSTSTNMEGINIFATGTTIGIAAYGAATGGSTVTTELQENDKHKTNGDTRDSTQSESAPDEAALLRYLIWVVKQQDDVDSVERTPLFPRPVNLERFSALLPAVGYPECPTCGMLRPTIQSIPGFCR